jgi:serine/threonine protein kinase
MATVGPISQYDILRKLARGGMGEVYLARQTGIEGFAKEVVIKRIHSNFAEDPHFVDMFLQEARIAALLDHPNIVQIYELGKQGDNYFIVMEYVRGLSLSRLLKATGAALPTPLAIQIAAGVAAGLQFAHERRDPSGAPLNLVHRDISPPNVLLSTSGSVKITDFGIAKVRQSVTQTQAGVIKGKWSYISPEQARGEAATPQSDIYSLGLVLYEMTTGVRAYPPGNDKALLRAVASGQVPPPELHITNYQVDLRAVLMKALEPDKTQRYQECQELQEDLLALLVNRQIVTSPAKLGQFVDQNFEEPTKRAHSMPRIRGLDGADRELMPDDVVAVAPIDVATGSIPADGLDGLSIDALDSLAADLAPEVLAAPLQEPAADYPEAGYPEPEYPEPGYPEPEYAKSEPEHPEPYPEPVYPEAYGHEQVQDYNHDEFVADVDTPVENPPPILPTANLGVDTGAPELEEFDDDAETVMYSRAEPRDDLAETTEEEDEDDDGKPARAEMFIGPEDDAVESWDNELAAQGAPPPEVEQGSGSLTGARGEISVVRPRLRPSVLPWVMLAASLVIAGTVTVWVLLSQSDTPDESRVVARAPDARASKKIPATSPNAPVRTPDAAPQKARKPVKSATSAPDAIPASPDLETTKATPAPKKRVRRPRVRRRARRPPRRTPPKIRVVDVDAEDNDKDKDDDYKTDLMVGTSEVTISTTPPCEVYMRGKRLGKTPVTLTLLRGTVVLELRNQNLGLRTTRRLKIAGPKVNARWAFGKGVLSFRLPPGRKVSLDGQPLGVTPIAPMAVYEGPHTLVITDPKTKKQRTRRVQVRPKRNVVVR